MVRCPSKPAALFAPPLSLRKDAVRIEEASLHLFYDASVGKPTSLHPGTGGGSIVIHHGQTRRIDTSYTMGAGESLLRITWIDDDGKYFKDFHVD
jgi:hypothetical protein